MNFLSHRDPVRSPSSFPSDSGLAIGRGGGGPAEMGGWGKRIKRGRQPATSRIGPSKANKASKKTVTIGWWREREKEEDADVNAGCGCEKASLLEGRGGFGGWKPLPVCRPELLPK
jgi:hypothetical protein